MLLLLVLWMTVVLRTDYNIKGVLLIFVLYMARDKRWLQVTCGAVWSLVWNGSIQQYGALAMIPVALYNGEKGPGMKCFFYLFYPVHLLVLYGISQWM